jgi:DNA-binding response OmpR family regulator
MTGAGGPTTALVADDDMEFRAFLIGFLRSEGFAVPEAANGLETRSSTSSAADLP